LFPQPVLDEDAVQRDLYYVKERDELKLKERGEQPVEDVSLPRDDTSRSGSQAETVISSFESPLNDVLPSPSAVTPNETVTLAESPNTTSSTNSTPQVDRTLTRMVEDRLYGYRRSATGIIEYSGSTFTAPEDAVKFRPDGIRIGRPLRVNCDLLTHHAKTALRRGKLEEATDLYSRAITMDPFDGRGYLGLSRCLSQKRRFDAAKKVLKRGISICTTMENGNTPDGNPFLLQALGVLEERFGHLGDAERRYIQAARACPSHAAAWVSLAQLRTRKLRQGPSAGRVCYATAERELARAGRRRSSYVYTAWASMEYKKAGDVRRARELFEMALDVDPKCSAAWLQLGVMEGNKGNVERARECFETVLKFDQRNSRVLQAYAVMESKQPDSDSREVIDMFERALRVNKNDAGVFQAYALYVAELGDIKGARDLLRQATTVGKKHAAAWQAWGVLETRCGTPSEARNIFQQGIWSCAQPGGGQSGGRRTARLWQAWGVLESQEQEHSAARRCFSRALDADSRNVAAVTAWTSMEASLGNYADARAIFESALRRFPEPCEETRSLWRSYELMEVKAGNDERAQMVYNRGMREAMMKDRNEETFKDQGTVQQTVPEVEEILKKSTSSSRNNEVEVLRWGKRDAYEGEVWMNNGSIEGKMPKKKMKKTKPAKRSTDTAP